MQKGGRIVCTLAFLIVAILLFIDPLGWNRLATLLGIVSLTAACAFFTPKLFRKELKRFTTSFRELDKRAGYQLTLDAIFVAALTFIGNWFQGFVRENVATIQAQAGNDPVLIMSAVKQLFASIIGFSVVSFLGVVLVYTITRAYIWKWFEGKQPSWNWSKRFFWINLTWLFAWGVAIISTLFLLKPVIAPTVTLIVAVVYLFMTARLHKAYLQSGTWKGTHQKTWTGGHKSLVHFIPGLLLSGIVLVLATLAVQWTIQLFRIPTTMVTSGLIVLVPFVTWFRRYLFSFLKAK